MIRWTVFAVGALMAVSAAAVPAAAQERKGFWGEFGVGVAGLKASAESSSGVRTSRSRDRGGVVELGLGWAVSPRVLAGFELKGVAGTGYFFRPTGALLSTFDVFTANASGILLVYPTASNFYVKGGAGGSFMETSAAVGTATLLESHGGFGFTTGAGYDVYLGRGFSVTPAVGFWYGRPGTLRFNNESIGRGWRFNAVDATVSIKFN